VRFTAKNVTCGAHLDTLLRSMVPLNAAVLLNANARDHVTEYVVVHGSPALSTLFTGNKIAKPLRDANRPERRTVFSHSRDAASPTPLRMNDGRMDGDDAEGRGWSVVDDVAQRVVGRRRMVGRGR
jgi:hypothetical protein